MKTMTCKELGGACDLEFHANTFEELKGFSMKHAHEMYEQGDEAHIKVMNEMRELMKDPEAMNAWMENKKKEFEALPEDKKITVTAEIDAPIEKVWEYWTVAEHIKNWNFASDDWECPAAENVVTVGGKFNIKMSAKDGSAGFDFEGKYTTVEKNQLIEYVMSDGREVSVEFISISKGTKISETFDIEQTHSAEMQREGWQAILNNFKKYVEEN